LFDFSNSKLSKMGFDRTKTEFGIMDDDLEDTRVYDSGSAIWEYIDKK